MERQIAKKLALSGISLSDVTILRAQGGQQAAMVTKDGKPNGRFAASMVDEAGMEKLLTFARNKAAALADEIYAGEMVIPLLNAKRSMPVRTANIRRSASLIRCASRADD